MEIRKAVLSISFFLAISIAGLAQRAIKDSLENLLKANTDNITRVELFSQLAYQYYDFNDSLAIRYSQEALALAKKINYLKGIKYGYTLVGLGYSSMGEFKKAITNFYKSDNITAPNSLKEASFNLVLWGNCYREVARYDSAIIFYNKAKSILTKNEGLELATVFKNMAQIDILQWRNEEAIQLLDSANALMMFKGDQNHFIQLDIWNLLGQAYQNLNQYNLSRDYYEKMCARSKFLDDYYHQISCKLNQAELAHQQSDYVIALKFGFEALEITKKYIFPSQYVKVLNQIGEVYSELSQFDVASEYFYKALSISERYGLRSLTAEIYSEIGWIKKDRGFYESALENANKSLQIRTDIGDKKGIANCYNLIGLIYLLKKDYVRSIAEQERGLIIREKLDYTVGISASIFNLSLVYEEINQIDKALEYQQRSIDIEEKLSNKLSLSISYNSKARLLLKAGKLDEAFVVLNKAKALANETKSKLLNRNVAKNFALYYEQKGDLKISLEYQKLYQVLNDSVYNESSAIRLTESEALYNIERKEKDIELLREKEEVQTAQLRLQKAEISSKNSIITFAIIGFILVAITGVFGYQMYNDKSKANRELKEQKEEIQAQSEELQEANQIIANINRSLEEKVDTRTSELRQAYKELDTFFYRSSHDFRRPITTFLGLANVAKITVKDTSALELFEKVAETATSLDKMLHKLQSISDLGANQMVFKEVFLKEQVNGIIDSLADLIKQKEVTVIYDVIETVPFVSYPAMVQIIIENLLENAIHFCGTQHPNVKIKTSVYQEVAIIEMEDNGQGIMDEYKSRIFEMYFRANERSKGNGLGLYIAKKAVEKLNGKIRFVSTYKQGSIFTVELPNLSNG